MCAPKVQAHWHWHYVRQMPFSVNSVPSLRVKFGVWSTLDTKSQESGLEIQTVLTSKAVEAISDGRNTTTSRRVVRRHTVVPRDVDISSQTAVITHNVTSWCVTLWYLILDRSKDPLSIIVRS
jgi:hypothetical protein